MPGMSHKVNQDSFLVIKNFANESTNLVYAVFDGHGVHGHHVSSFLKRNFGS